MTTRKILTNGSKRQSATKLSNFAAQIMNKISERGTVRLLDCGGAMVPGKKAPAALINELLHRDLVSTHGDGLIVITQPGRQLLRRRASEGKSPAGNGAVRAAFASQHQLPMRTLLHIDGKDQAFDVNLGETPLGWLCRRKGKDGGRLVSEQQLEAADRLRGDFEQAGLRQRVTASYEGLPVSKRRSSAGGLVDVERSLDSCKRYDAAVTAMGPGLSDIVVRVCCHLEGLGIAEKGMSWPARSGKIVLLLGLDRLAEHYEKLDYGRKRQSAG